jgi:hypothetical protein
MQQRFTSRSESGAASNCRTISPCWPADKVERRAVAELVPYARNARTHSAEQVEQLVASIKEWGWTTPILLDEEGGIIAGHGRVLAAKKLKIETVPCMVARGWSEAQKRAYVIADNKLALNAGWDDELLRLELDALQALDFDLTPIGFDELELGALTGDAETAGRSGAGSLAERFMVAPFSVLNARDGWWQDRKRAWLALGIRSELGRGDTAVNTPHEGRDLVAGLLSIRAAQKAERAAKATPGGSPMPAADYSKRQRGDGKGRAIVEG